MSYARPLLIVAVLALPGLLAAPQARSATLCVFESNSYSEGARICAEPEMLMICSVNGDRAVWTVAPDKDRAGVCADSSRRGTSRMERRKAGRRAATEPATPTADAPKCFTFASKRYCE